MQPKLAIDLTASCLVVANLGGRDPRAFDPRAAEMPPGQRRVGLLPLEREVDGAGD